MSKRTLVTLALVAGLAGAAALALRLARAPESDEARIRALFEAAARAAEAGRPAEVIEALSERFRGQGLDRQGAKRLVAWHVLRGEWVSVSVAGVAVAVDGDAARADVDAVLSRAAGKGKALRDLLPGEASAHRFACRLEREDRAWRVVSAEWRPISVAEALAGPPAPGR
jgi:phosphoserine phosphatase